MRVRAVAVAAERSNAVGALELECTPQGLVMVYLGVGSFSEGYATGARTEDTRAIVPWSALNEARLEGRRLFLAFDKATSPHNRITLMSFELGDRAHRAEIPRRRLVWWLGILGAIIVALLGALFIMPAIAADRAASAVLLLGAGFAVALLLVGLVADQGIKAGGGDSDGARELFVGELAVYFPALTRTGRASRPKKTRRPINLQALLPRTTAAVVITLTASALGAVLMGRWLMANERAPKQVRRVPPSQRDRVDDLATAVTASMNPEPVPVLPAQPEPGLPALASAPETAQATPGVVPGSAARVLGSCECARGDSALWQEPIPRLSILLLSSKTRTKGAHQISELEVAVVNNSDKPLREITLQVNFFERDPNPVARRHLISNRPLYFEGPLVPGQAIKWSTEAEGTDFEIENPIAGDIGPEGDGAAPLSRFAELLDAVHRPVRLHGAMMLAYFRDPRAREAALKLRDALREDESPYLNRVLQALTDVSVCQLTVQKEGPSRSVHACVFNSSDVPRNRLAIRIRALGDEVSHRRPVGNPPELVAEATWTIPGELAPHRGARVNASLDVGRGDSRIPKAFEAFADREDLLP